MTFNVKVKSFLALDREGLTALRSVETSSRLRQAYVAAELCDFEIPYDEGARHSEATAALLVRNVVEDTELGVEPHPRTQTRTSRSSSLPDVVVSDEAGDHRYRASTIRIAWRRL